MRLSPTVLAFIAASGVVGLSSSQAKATPLPDAPSASTAKQAVPQPGGQTQEDFPTPLTAPLVQAEPVSLEDASQVDDYTADALVVEPASPVPPDAGLGLAELEAATTAANAIQTLRNQIQQHRSSHQVDPATLISQQESERFDSVPTEALPGLGSPTAQEPQPR